MLWLCVHWRVTFDIVHEIVRPHWALLQSRYYFHSDIKHGKRRLHVKVTRGRLEMVDLGCQLDHIWYQLNPNQLGMLWRIFLIGSLEVRRPIWNLATLSGGSLHIKTQKKEALLFVCLPPTLTGKFTNPAAEAFLCWNQNLFLWDSNVDQRPAEIANLVNWITTK